ncbi:MAG: phosphotransferase family protein, partial [Pyrinomonadaceae bacterium]|nr:phosphotransferase family protein [Pyrinomonadaceae bacterium]
EYVLRRPPFGNRVKSAHDMSREFNVLSKLSKVYQPAPKPILYCGDESVIGSEFYLMERRNGLIIRGAIPTVQEAVATREDASTAVRPLQEKQKKQNEGGFYDDDGNHPGAEAPPLLRKEGSRKESNTPSRAEASVPRALATGQSAAETRTSVSVSDLSDSQEYRFNVCESFIENLAALHSLDYKKAGLTDLGKPEGYTRRQVEGWTNRYYKAKTDEHPELEAAIKWLNENIPDDDPPALVHNDYKFDNVMLDPKNLTKIVAVLDWEMATIGSPLMDLGTTLAYWMSNEAGEEMLSMPFNPRILMENVSRTDLVQMYADKSGRDVSNIVYYYVFGTFKVAVIAQQIYYRYVKRFTKDKRFAGFGFFVKKLGEIGSVGVETNRI